MASKNDPRFFKYHAGDGGNIQYKVNEYKALVELEGVKCNKCDKSIKTTFQYQLFYGPNQQNINVLGKCMYQQVSDVSLGIKMNDTKARNVQFEVDFNQLYGNIVHVTVLALIKDDENKIIDKIFYRNIQVQLPFSWIKDFEKWR